MALGKGKVMKTPMEIASDPVMFAEYMKYRGAHNRAVSKVHALRDLKVPEPSQETMKALTDQLNVALVEEFTTLIEFRRFLVRAMKM